MFQLNDIQINIVYKRLQIDRIIGDRLDHELVDHCCCFMEAAMESDEDFDKAYAAAVKALAPNGIEEIKHEHFFLLNLNRQFTMKKLIFSSGFAAVFLLSTGLMFKTFNWPVSNMVMAIALGFVLNTIMLTGLHIVVFKKKKSAPFLFRSISGMVSLTFIAMGFLLRLSGFPGSNILYAVGTVTFNFIFMPAIFYWIYKNGVAKSKVYDAV